jgi:tetratricopeptide (TPR) repeat protein
MYPSKTQNRNFMKPSSRLLGAVTAFHAMRSIKIGAPQNRSQSRRISLQTRLSKKSTSHQTDLQLRQQALADARCGNHEGAIQQFNQLLRRNPSAMDYNNRGLVYFQSAQYEQAIADYNRALELNPHLDTAYNNRANYYAHQGKLLDAILDYERAIDLNPSNVKAWINQGITFRDLKMYDQALESLETALIFGRLESHIFAERGRTYHLCGDWNCAIADYKRAIARLPDTDDHSLQASTRLRLQIEHWLGELLSPLNLGQPID